MKLLSQTIKVSLVLVLALFSNSIVPVGIASALEAEGLVPPVDQTAQSEPTKPVQDVAPVVTETPPAPAVVEPPTEPEVPVAEESTPTPPEETPAPVVDTPAPSLAARTIEPFVQPEHPQQQPKVTICHATNSFSNPYVQIDVDQNAADGISGNSGQTADHTSHTGQVFYPGIAAHSWGDIIKPIVGIPGSGLNWSTAGQAIWNNDCNVPLSITATPGPCVKDEGSSTLTITVYGTAKDSILVVTGPNGEVYRETIDVNKDGEVVSPDFPVTINDLNAGKYTISVLSKNGKNTLKEVTATIEECPATVIEEVDQPKFHDVCSTDRDFVYIPSTEGVTYYITTSTSDGAEKVSHGRHYVSGEVTVTTAADEGYVLGEEVDSGPWSHTFTDAACLGISKTGVTPTDTNHDGKIGAGDMVTWYITVTNLSDSDDDALQNLQVTDPTATSLTNDGEIDYLAPGDKEILEASTPLTAAEVTACKASNSASVIGYRYHGEEDRVSLQNDEWNHEEDGFTASTTASVSFTCPVTGNVLGDSTTATIVTPTPQVLAAATAPLPEVLPATGGESNYGIVLGILLSGLTYYVMLKRQEA